MLLTHRSPRTGLVLALEKYSPKGVQARYLCRTPRSRVTPSADDAQPAIAPKIRSRFLADLRLTEREIFLSVLQNSASKREAKAYISRFTPWKKSGPDAASKVEHTVAQLAGQGNYDSYRLSKTGVNLGGLYSPAKAIEESPLFIQQPVIEQAVQDAVEPLHVALIKLRQPQTLDDETLGGIGLTVSQLVRLGLNLVVVIDCDSDQVSDQTPDENCFTTKSIEPEWQELICQQADRVARSISDHSRTGAIPLRGALAYSDPDAHASGRALGGVEVRNNELVFPLLDAGIVPIFVPIACADDTQRNLRVQADDVVLALTENFAGFRKPVFQGNEPFEIIDQLITAAKLRQQKLSVDRIIVLDPLGGIPSVERQDRAHVFINLQQEYEDVKQELLQMHSSNNGGSTISTPKLEHHETQTVLGSSNPFSSFAEDESNISHSPSTLSSPIITSKIAKGSPLRHVQNLNLIQKSLNLLPSSSSAIITTPMSAAISSQSPASASPGVRTRPQKNPLIHNLLTDKPMISSSLPPSRFASPVRPILNPSTFLKKGTPLTMVPDPQIQPWKPPVPGETPVTLRDPRIDFPRLLHLIEDSFGRKLDVDHYLSRIQDRLAGVIIAGEYDGGAILTWEYPEGSTDPSRAVPYLDKFAVLRRAQGSGGVADIVFRAMIRTCFPDGVVWRSRSTNPVNKWYFERSAGTWKLPGDEWTMFWTTEGLGNPENAGKFDDYARVCAAVVPSFSDGKPE